MVLVLLLVIAYPLADSLWLSLHRVNLANPEQGQPFVGLDNYLYAFRQPAYWSSIHRTLYFTLLSVALELALGLLFAVLLNERFRGNLGARLAMIFPWTLLTVSNGVLWAWILNPTYGVANACSLSRVLQAPKAWLKRYVLDDAGGHPGDVWKMVPTMTLLLLADLQPISHLTCTRRLRSTAPRAGRSSAALPCRCCPVMLVAVVLRTIGAFRVFDLIYVLTGNGGPADSTKVIAFYAYDQAFHYPFFGDGAAISWLITAGMRVLIVIYMHWLRPEGER
jgi:ABC-type sugar transport system permease subunit